MFREKELPGRTPGMANAATDIFKTGAIVHADIDLVSRRAFVWMGGAGGALPNLSYEEQFAGFYDWDGRKVYVKSVDMRRLTNGAIKNVPHGILNFGRVVRDIPLVYGDVYGGSTNATTYVHAFQTNAEVCHFNTTANMSSFSCIQTIYYTCTDR